MLRKVVEPVKKKIIQMWTVNTECWVFPPEAQYMVEGRHSGKQEKPYHQASVQ